MFYYTTVNTSRRLQAVLKMSAFCSDAGCQTTTPLINGSVNNVLFQILPDGYQFLSPSSFQAFESQIVVDNAPYQRSRNSELFENLSG